MMTMMMIVMMMMIMMMMTCECSGVPCEGAMIAFLSGWASSLLEESIRVSGFLLAQLCQIYQAQEKLASESMSQRWGFERPHCVTRLGGNASSGVTEGLNEETDVSGKESCFILAGVTALSRDSVKILPNFCLVSVRTVLGFWNSRTCSSQKYSDGPKTDLS